eukprot:TRINITY_DN5785_c0_g2_i1.p2 TRINITY_DN5785_c0_g2~~TRINITY_DN5785_c0_g2_i1.p2  ORF type:complete len:210 (+),score=19.23 TRINITY_DN5785_c0_g2_i1:1214-1843(+)
MARMSTSTASRWARRRRCTGHPRLRARSSRQSQPLHLGLARIRVPSDQLQRGSSMRPPRRQRPRCAVHARVSVADRERHDVERADLGAVPRDAHRVFPPVGPARRHVTGKPAVYVDVPEKQFFSVFDQTKPYAYEDPEGMKWVDNFAAFFRNSRDGVVVRDYAVLDKIHPNRVNLEGWMRKTGYDGSRKTVLKSYEDKVSPTTKLSKFS